MPLDIEEIRNRTRPLEGAPASASPEVPLDSPHVPSLWHGVILSIPDENGPILYVARVRPAEDADTSRNFFFVKRDSHLRLFKVYTVDLVAAGPYFQALLWEGATDVWSRSIRTVLVYEADGDLFVQQPFRARLVTSEEFGGDPPTDCQVSGAA